MGTQVPSGRKKEERFSLDNYNSEYFKLGQKTSQRHIRQFFYNNSYLLKKNNIRVLEQINYFKEQGVKVSGATIRKFRCGMLKSCAVVYLSFFSNYWNISIPVMMDQDFEALDKLGKLDLDQLRG